MTARTHFKVFLGVTLLVAVALAVIVAPWASSSPDGLEKVAIEEGFATDARDHALADAPTADYGIAGVDHEGIGTGLAGLLGIAVTFGAVWGLLTVLHRLRRPPATSRP